MSGSSHAPPLWLLNFDCELELAEGRSYSPRRAITLAMERVAPQAERLTLSDPWLLPSPQVTPPHGSFRGLLPWCPTWQSSRFAKQLGLRELSLVEPDLVQSVTSREFFFRAKPSALSGRCVVRTETELREFLGSEPFQALASPGVYRTKRFFSSQGRGQRTLRERLIKDDLNFLLAGVRQGGLLIEPELEVLAEYSLHGMLLEGEVSYGQACSLRVDEHSAPLSITLAGEGEVLENALLALAEPFAAALYRAGYRGPFGIDFLKTRNGLVASELNARFTLGWSLGMAEKRDEVLSAYLEACERRA